MLRLPRLTMQKISVAGRGHGWLWPFHSLVCLGYWFPEWILSKAQGARNKGFSILFKFSKVLKRTKITNVFIKNLRDLSKDTVCGLGGKPSEVMFEERERMEWDSIAFPSKRFFAVWFRTVDMSLIFLPPPPNSSAPTRNFSESLETKRQARCSKDSLELRCRGSKKVFAGGVGAAWWLECHVP